MAKYCHRCGHRHLSERPSHFLRRPWSASAAHKAPKRVRFGRKLYESDSSGWRREGARLTCNVLTWKFRRIVGCVSAPSPLSSMRLIRHMERKLYNQFVCVCKHPSAIQLQLPWCVTLDQGSHRCDACETPLVRLSLVAQPFQLAFLHPGADEWQHGFGW